MSQNDRMLVTGGAGFIGSHLCEHLLDAGHNVLCVDNYLTGSTDNIRHLIDNPQFEVLCHDVTAPMNVEVGEIYNLACPASPSQYQKDAVRTTMTSIYGAINVLNLAIHLGVRVFQASTSEVYGDPEVHPQSESYWGRSNCIGPRACYDEGKRCAESLFFDYHRQHLADIKVARIFNTYGPRMRPNDGRVVSNFIVQALRHEDITVYGDGSQTRAFCYIDDLVEAIVCLMATEGNFPGPVNLGNPEECTIVSLANTIIEIIGSRSNIVFCDLPEDDPVRRCPDISLAKEKLNWKPTTSLSNGLVRTIAYFDDLMSH